MGTDEQAVIDFATAFLEQLGNKVILDMQGGYPVPDLNGRPEPESVEGMLHNEMNAVRGGKIINKRGEFHARRSLKPECLYDVSFLRFIDCLSV